MHATLDRMTELGACLERYFEQEGNRNIRSGVDQGGFFMEIGCRCNGKRPDPKHEGESALNKQVQSGHRRKVGVLRCKTLTREGKQIFK